MCHQLKIQIKENSLSFQVHLQPRSSSDKIVGVKEGILYIKVKAPPVEGKANDSLKNFLAKVLSIKSYQIFLKGEKFRNKIIEIINLKEEQLINKLKEHFLV